MSFSQNIHTHMEQLGREFQTWYDNWIAASWTIHNEMQLLPPNTPQSDPSYIYQAMIADLIEKQGVLIEMEAHTRGLLRAIQQNRMQTLPMPPTFNIREPSAIGPPWRHGFNPMVHFSGQPRLTAFTPPFARPQRHSYLPITGTSYTPSAPSSTASSTSGFQTSIPISSTTSGESTSRNKSFLRIENPSEQNNAAASTSERAQHSSASTITPEVPPEKPEIVEQLHEAAPPSTKPVYSVDAPPFVSSNPEVKTQTQTEAEEKKEKTVQDQIDEDAKRDGYFRQGAQKTDANEGTAELVDNSHVPTDRDTKDSTLGAFFDDNMKNGDYDHSGLESRMSTATTTTQFYDALSDVEDPEKAEEDIAKTSVPQYESSSRPSSVLMKKPEGRPRFGRGSSEPSSNSPDVASSATPTLTQPSTIHSVSEVSWQTEPRFGGFASRHEAPKVEKEVPAEKVYPVFPAASDAPKTSGFSEGGFGGRMRSEEEAACNNNNSSLRDDFGERFSKLRSASETVPNTSRYGPERFGLGNREHSEEEASRPNSFFSDRTNIVIVNEPQKPKELSAPTKLGARPRFGLTPENQKRNSEASASSVSESRPSSSHSSVFRPESQASTADVGMRITIGQSGRTVTNGVAFGSASSAPKAAPSADVRYLPTDREISTQRQHKSVPAATAFKSLEEPSRPASRATFGKVNGEPASGQARSHTSLGQGDGRGSQIQEPTQALTNYHNGASLGSFPAIPAPEKAHPVSATPFKPPKTATLVFDGPLKKKSDAGDHRPTFEETEVPSKLVDILAQNGIREPTELEFEILLGFAEGKQMVIKAPPKSGKSLSYVCAVVSQISLKPAVCIETVIVTETASEAKSIHDLMMCLGSFCPINYLLCDDRTVTLESTKAVFGNKQVQLVIGTADRLLKVLPENNCDMDKIRLVIIDNVREACIYEETGTDYLSRLCNKMGNRMLQQVIIGDEFSPDQWIRLTSEQSMDRPHTSVIKNVRVF